jgi:broad specificity phosphatase PhoE
VFFITHPDVMIDPAVPVPDWPLNLRGRSRTQALATRSWISNVRRIFSSNERKARDAAQILADGLRLDGYRIVDDLGENDRSAPGFLDKTEFAATANAFLLHPKPAYAAGSPRSPRRRASSVRSSSSLRKTLTAISTSLGMAAPGRFFTVISPVCRSAATSTSQPAMAATGLLSAR